MDTKEQKMALEMFADFSEEYIAAFTTTEDPYREYYCIVPEGSDDISAALEDTLEMFLGEPDLSDDDIRQIMGAVRKDAPEDAEEEGIYPGPGYYIPGQILTFRKLGFIKEYQAYCMRWYADHGIALEDLMEDMDEPAGIYAWLGSSIEARTGDRPMGYMEFVETHVQGEDTVPEGYITHNCKE